MSIDEGFAKRTAAISGFGVRAERVRALHTKIESTVK
jgi:hypothetical protein